MHRFLITLTASLFFPLSLAAQNMFAITVDETHDDMTFAVESAILDMGLTIDFTSHTGEMLERTRMDVGSDVVLFDDATIFNFCSASVSRQVIEANLNNIVFCPYAVFVYTLPGNPDQTIVGHQVYPGASMTPANELLDEIVRSATQ
ncbi:MAG: DUF302 domain-containing protein [Rhodobacteraceae bacterium]|nr:DUF302 domain-containing protein [Paracoccaceae bacterium]